ncbi:hypothetical protein KQX54_017480 [Cotesia glomerata]|uniref:Uncharacterized protein n=1 Tax=Cotesia glomerata TaxID=32391 RepID=A0AAV7HV60_COTGL|nr:hypothetical protein KQX54_017480 [Cotesia glomerata]
MSSGRIKIRVLVYHIPTTHLPTSGPVDPVVYRYIPGVTFPRFTRATLFSEQDQRCRQEKSDDDTISIAAPAITSPTKHGQLPAGGKWASFRIQRRSLGKTCPEIAQRLLAAIKLVINLVIWKKTVTELEIELEEEEEENER